MRIDRLMTPAGPALVTLRARNGAALTVHRLGPGDIPALQAFNDGLSDRTRSMFLPHAYDEATLSRYVRREAKGEDRIYVARAGDGIAGYFFLWEFDQPVPLLGIGLADAWQGQGLGAAMLRILIADARAAGRDAVELTTVPANERAFRLYQKLGFEHAGDVENVAGDGRVVREHRLFLALKPGARPPERAFKPPVS